MQVSTILDHIDSGHMALPEFQRGYVWNRDQVRGLMASLYKRHPVGSLLVWATESKSADHRGDNELAAGIVKLLLDGQQRITSLYGVIRGKAPAFFDGDNKAFTDLFFNLESEEFSFYMPKKMKNDPLWIDVSRLMKEGIGPFIAEISANAAADKTTEYFTRLNLVHGIRDINFQIEEVTGEDKTIDVVVDIFNRVNSGGTKLSKGDLALAKICADWPDARSEMRDVLKEWSAQGFNFELDWLLRNINTIATGEALFKALHQLDSASFKAAMKKAVKIVNNLLNVISGRLGLDHSRVLFGPYAFPVLTHYISHHEDVLFNEVERDKLLFWYLHSAMWGKFSGSTESMVNKDLELIRDTDNGLDVLIKDLLLWRGDLHIRPEHFSGWSKGARFYPMLYMLTRMGDAMDWGLGIPLKENLLGKHSKLEVHHIFPKAYLKKNGYGKAQINAIANFCFLTKDTNIKISDSNPEIYFEEVERKYPGALASQWIPMDKELWKVENYPAFLIARQQLLAEAANQRLDSLYQLPGTLVDSHFGRGTKEAGIVSVEGVEGVDGAVIEGNGIDIVGGITSEAEELALEALNQWMLEHKLPEAIIEYELVDHESGDVIAHLDMAWPEGIQAGYSNPLALLIDEGPEVLNAANQNGFTYFTDVDALKTHVMHSILGEVKYGLPDWADELDDSIVSVARHIIKTQLDVPDCGYELINDQGEVCGEFEIAWPHRKVGIWTGRGNESQSDVRTMGWLVFEQHEVLENAELLNRALQA